VRRTIGCGLIALSLLLACDRVPAAGLQLGGHDTFEMHGLSVLVYQSRYHPVFRDQKIGGIEIILHDERIATDGEVRLGPTPEQWDPVPTFADLKRGPRPNELIVDSGYPDRSLKYQLVVTAEGEGVRVAVHLDRPLPPDLVGKAGFNLDFLPTAYFGKSYILDGASGIFPRQPMGPVKTAAGGSTESLPMATAKSIVLSPEDPLTRVAISSDTAPLMLYDARDKAQNGWFVVRSLIPAGRTGDVIVWHVRPHVVPGWVRKPVVSYNQLGYTPARSKVAVVELDPLYRGPALARVLRVGADGRYHEAFRGKLKPWGRWLRYKYATFDFSQVRRPGIYAIAYGGHTFDPFRIGPDVYDRAWQPSLDTYIPEQMDHVEVREAYRVWHGVSHMDDARQAPVNHVHFDGYAQGPTTDSPFAPGEHIPGLNVGGWQDAGDFDIRTETQSAVIRDLVMDREMFHNDWDQDSVDEAARLVTIHKPDGVPDIIEQIRHGVLQLMAQYDVIGHAIPGIIAPTLEEYTFIGDARSKTDGLVFSPKMSPLESNGINSGVPDDRWAFTTHSTPLNYEGAAALAAASRVLRDYDDALAQKCLQTAIRVWDEEHKSPPALFHSFNTTGGDLDDDETLAAVELVLATKGQAPYTSRLKELLPAIRRHFIFVGWNAVRALPYMDSGFHAAIESMVTTLKPGLDAELAKNPFGVPITTGGWAGSSVVASFGIETYVLHQAFPSIIGPDDTLRAFDYLLGRHPVSNVSLVSAVGTKSELIAYGHNRADFSFVPGGVVPGVLIVPPDFPELIDAWPFLWYEKEYVVDGVSRYILAASAADAVTKEAP
jgi:endoglucanase